jgi:hypothetical protein
LLKNFTDVLIIKLFAMKRIILFLFFSTAILMSCEKEGPPRAGDWNVTTDFGKFVLTVNSDGSYITKLAITFSGYSCGGITQSGTVTISSSPGWSISKGKFNISNSIDPQGNVTLTINGTFSKSGEEASGSWSLNAYGTNCSGSWDCS